MQKAPAMVATTDQERVLLEACSLSAEECFTRMGSREKGLSAEEVEEKRREFGTNEVSTKKGGLLLRTYHRFANPLVVQLLVIAGVSFIMGDIRSTIVVGDPACRGRSGGRRCPGRGHPRSGGPAPYCHEGFLREPERAHRGIHAG